MKKLNYLIALLVAALMLIQTGCNKDDDKPATGFKLVVVKRSTGALYTVDKSNGNLTEIGSLTINGEPLTGLRGLVYDLETELCYGGATYDGGKGFYSINIKTGVYPNVLSLSARVVTLGSMPKAGSTNRSGPGLCSNPNRC